jgi:2-amino-4-hydroxy-6-hydroxymethyldihydropteridine diphosphokinase
MSRAVLSIGSNLGDRLGRLRGVVEAVRPWLLAVSPVYETDPWGGVEQDDFLNAILVVDDPQAGPETWLERAQAAEQAADRVRAVHWGPRSLDVDVVDVAGVVSDAERLMLPHPRAAERAFVLVPWLAADPQAQLNGRPVSALVNALPPEDVAGVRLRADLVLEA